MKKFNIVDLHCDTLMGCYRGMPLAKNDGHIDLEKLQKGGALAQFFAIWIPTGPSAERHGVHEGPYPYFQHTYEAYLREMELNKAVIAPALCYADIQKNLAEGKISSILTIEDGGSVFEGKMERLEEAYQKGVRLITLTWFYENCIGFPCSKDRPDLMDLGLKPFGIDAVRRMNELGIVADSITEIKTVCACGVKATVNARIDEAGYVVTAGQQVFLGGNDSYVAMCHRCWTHAIRDHKKVSRP